MHHLEDFLNLGDRVEESGTSRLSGFCNFVSLARRIVEREVVSGGFRFFYLHSSLPCLFAGFYFVRLIHLGRRVYSCNLRESRLCGKQLVEYRFVLKIEYRIISINLLSFFSFLE